MKRNIEHFLLVLLLAISVILGLSFWLNTVFKFNLFCGAHWDELARLQASNTPINKSFYMSFIVASVIFLTCTYIIYNPKITLKTHKKTEEKKQQQQSKTQNTQTKPNNDYDKTGDSPIPIPTLPISRPPRLNLPSNMAEVAKQHNMEQNKKQQNNNSDQENPYNPMLAEIFTNNGFAVKPSLKLSNFSTNLFAIGPDEVVWIGAVDADINKFQECIEKLKSIFVDTLEDIEINVNSFMLDTQNKYQSNDSSILLVKSVEELNKILAENPAVEIDENNSENFNAYSEYIDTIIQYAKNM